MATQKVVATVLEALEDVHGFRPRGRTLMRPDAASEVIEMIHALELFYIEHRILPQDQPCDQAAFTELTRVE
jgi:hypothetical protein